ncbi:PAAR domain-containing protein [Acinetobacter sp. WZC-1]|uniref:PAAR domain-containing protein n=1 Tax=Acinetobacter sp. WZC-1 TaxID=3459034 RepID=UPI00403DC42E
MAKPTFLHELPIEQLQQMSEEDIKQTLKAEQLYLENKPRTVHDLAVNGARSRESGLVKASVSGLIIDGLSVARVGDDVIYADGTISKIVSGAGSACIVKGKPVALVGSHLENGDEIVDSPNKFFAINIFKGDKAPEGFLKREEDVQHG